MKFAIYFALKKPLKQDFISIGSHIYLFSLNILNPILFNLLYVKLLFIMN